MKTLNIRENECFSPREIWVTALQSSLVASRCAQGGGPPAELLGQNAEPGGGELVPLHPQLTSYITSRKALDCSVLNFSISQSKAIFLAPVPTPPRALHGLITYDLGSALSAS